MRKTANIGYKQELKRHYSSFQVFSIAFSIMGLLPSISATLWFSVPAGPVGMVWVSRLGDSQRHIKMLTMIRDGSQQVLLYLLLP